MAYNPFNIFRRNQRAIFAVITVFIMFTFVLSSGLGGGADFFDWFPSWLGSKKRGEQVCTIDSNKVYQGELDKLRFRRVMANRFMELAAAVAEDNLQQTTLPELMKSASPEFQRLLNLVRANPQYASLLSTFQPQRPEDQEVVKALNALQTISQMRMVAASQGRHYFLNAPNRNNRDLIEFMLWEKKADQMRIRFTEDDIKALIQKEFYGQFKSDVAVRKQLEKDLPRFSIDECLKAIGDEFRVRTVQTALLGHTVVIDQPGGGRMYLDAQQSVRDDSTLSFPPLLTPPYEMYDFYREKVSPTTYWAVAVPGANFAERVTGNPSEAELRALYDKYKDQEYDPSKEEPGFRQPRKIKVEWVGATGTEPYYQKKAEEWVAKAEQIRKTEVGALSVPLPGSGPGVVGLSVAPMAVSDPLIFGKYYQDVAFKHGFIVRNQYSSASVLPWDLLDTSIVRPANLAAATGGLAGGLAGFGGPGQAVAATFGGAVQFELRDRVRAGAPLVLGSIPGPGMGNTFFSGAAAYQFGTPGPLPIDAFRPSLLKQVTEDKAKEMALADLRKLKTDIEQLNDPKHASHIKNPAERLAKTKEMIANFIKERGLTIGSTTDFRDEWTIEDDPGMAPLKAVLKPDNATDPHRGVNRPVQFGKKFFWKDDFSKLDLRDPRALEIAMSGNLPKTPATGTYQPDFYPQDPGRLSPSEKTFLFWRTEEKAATPLTPDQAKNSGALLAAWKRIKGREMAKARAEEIANRLRGRSATASQQVLQNVFDEDKILRDEFRGNEKATERVKVFAIDDVAPLSPGMDMSGMGMGGGGKTLRPFRLDPSTNIPFPTKEMEKTLLDERERPVGTVLVLADQPKDMYYVVTLVNRRVLTPRDFNFEVYSQFAQQGGVGRVVRSTYDREAVKKARESVVNLLKKEFEYTETDEQKKKLDANAAKEDEQ
ncbi:MAG TPA: hypothetical protein VKE74_15460 [Gemmataceae bacterium]|nr:hypothetical protein [Gemmataceae bacterium]